MTTKPTKLSVLDLSPVIEGGCAADSLRNTLDLARHAERLGYERYWLAEHHNMRGIASAATAVVIGHVAAGTKTIRVGAGGIMLPNHAPLIIAEQFGTLASLFPNRIDLGLGRAPGTDPRTTMALRRNLGGADSFPDDVVELRSYFRAEDPAHPAVVRAVPGQGLEVPIWILGSSLFGAELAAVLGLPYAFASHFAPADLDRAIALYRARFQPSPELAAPYVMVGMNVFAADRTDDAELLFTSLAQAFVNLRSGRPGPLPPPARDFGKDLPPAATAMLAQALSCSAIGDEATVTRKMAEFLERTRADEIIVTAQIYDHAARVRSFEIAMGAFRSLASTKRHLL